MEHRGVRGSHEGRTCNDEVSEMCPVRALSGRYSLQIRGDQVAARDTSHVPRLAETKVGAGTQEKRQN